MRKSTKSKSKKRSARKQNPFCQLTTNNAIAFIGVSLVLLSGIDYFIGHNKVDPVVAGIGVLLLAIGIYGQNRQ